MPSPSQSLATLRPDLVESFMEFDLEADARGFGGLRVFPVIEVGLQADNPGRIPLKELLINGKTGRASDGGYHRSEFEFETFAYATKEHGREERLSERDAKRYRHFFTAEQVSTARAYGLVQRAQEQRVIDQITSTTIYTGPLTTAAGSAWSNPSGADPAADVETAVEAVYDRTGLWCNAVVMSYKKFRQCRNVDEIIDRINSQGAGDQTRASDITVAQLQEVFAVDHVIVCGASKNTADQGQSATPEQIFPDDRVFVAKVAESGDIREPCVGRTFHWSEDGSSIGGTIEQYWEEQTRSDIYRVRHDTDEVLMYKEAGHLITGA